jgi:divalent metal cation (Fe/Co/Zn/Cd) transporter
MLAVAGFLLWYGIGLINHPAVGTPAWLGGIVIGVAALKVAAWIFVATVRIRRELR